LLREKQRHKNIVTNKREKDRIRYGRRMEEEKNSLINRECVGEREERVEGGWGKRQIKLSEQNRDGM
jgi:hypothetical protein